MALPAYFVPDSTVTVPVTNSASTVNLPGTPASDTAVRVANLGPNPICCAIGSSVTVANGLVVLPGESIFIGISSGTQISFIQQWAAASYSSVSITTGT